MQRLQRRRTRSVTSTPPPEVADAVRSALRHAVGEARGGKPVVVATSPWDGCGWLSPLAASLAVATSQLGQDHTLPAAAAVVIAPPEHGPSSAGPTWLPEELDLAYQALAPGGLLVLGAGLPAARRWRGRRRAPATPAQPGDALGIPLFRAGFVDPRFVAAGDGTWWAVARRGADLPPAQRTQVLSVVMPVYNERATFSEMIGLLLAKTIPGMAIELILVESNSTDGTKDEVAALESHPRVTVIYEDRPQGKGHAVRAGFARANGDFVLIQDADMEYSIDDYEPLLDPLRRAEASFVLGRRVSPQGSWGIRQFESQVHIGRALNIGHVVFLSLFNVLYRQRLKDPFTMYKVFRRDCIAGMAFESNRFDFDWELVAKLLRAGYAPIELPAQYKSRSFSEGKKIRVLRDPLTWVRACLRYRLVPVFGPLDPMYATGDLRGPGAPGSDADLAAGRAEDPHPDATR